jgi:hypothetical protein
MVSFLNEEVAIEKYDNVQLCSKYFVVHNLSAPHKWEIQWLKENCAHVIYGPMEHNKGVV